MQFFDALIWPPQSHELNKSNGACLEFSIQTQPKKCFNGGSMCKLLSMPSLFSNVKRLA